LLRHDLNTLREPLADPQWTEGVVDPATRLVVVRAVRRKGRSHDDPVTGGSRFPGPGRL